MSKSRILLLLLGTSLLSYVANAEPPTRPNFAGSRCDYDMSVEPDPEHVSTAKTLIEDLRKNALQLSSYHSSAGSGAKTLYGQYYCRGDIDSNLCGQCVAAASLDGCFFNLSTNRTIVWYEECTLRYNNHSMLGILELDRNKESTYSASERSQVNVTTDPEKFGSVLKSTMDKIIINASSGNGSRGFATGEGLVSDSDTVYCLVQCSPDLTGIQCETCLRAAYKVFIPPWVQFMGMYFSSCQIRYSNYGAFYLLPDAPSALSPSPQSPHQTTDKEIKVKKASNYVVRAVIPAVVVGLFVIIAISFCLFGRKRLLTTSSRGHTTKAATETTEVAERGIQTTDCVQFDLQSIDSATNSFSLSNKLGQGGFGIVYQGMLNDGQTVAVKRLSTGSGQGSNEFKTEVAVLAKLQHKNLVQLVGFCVDGDERLLVYEFLSNLSLDRFLFDPVRSASLTWPIRYNIIKGIVRGLHYLHEDSRVKIVHRDLKISNVLLDDNLDPKIADFGLAKLVKVDQTTANTSKVVGTYGYMSPEYALVGRYSTKSDVYSLGVIVLEILSGKNNSVFYDMSHNEGLLRHAWRVWNEGEIEQIMDPVMQNSYSRIEAKRCLHIGLLCVQDDATVRPTMHTVLVMLSSNTTYPSLPSSPPHYNYINKLSYGDEIDNESTSKEQENGSTLSSTTFSAQRNLHPH